MSEKTILDAAYDAVQARVIRKMILTKLKKRNLKLDQDENVDAEDKEIKLQMKNEIKHLSLEFIFEILSRLGGAPNLLYDDNGHWSITDEGIQSVDHIYHTEELGEIHDVVVDVIEKIEKDDDIEFSFFVPLNQWSNSISEALSFYLDSFEE